MHRHLSRVNTALDRWLEDGEPMASITRNMFANLVSLLDVTLKKCVFLLSQPEGKFISAHSGGITRASQRDKIALRSQLSITAIFLSGVTATAIQYIPEPPQSVASQSVALTWFISLVCSLYSAVGNQLVIAWMSSPARSPLNKTPRVIRLIIVTLPTASLAFAFFLLIYGLTSRVFRTKHTILSVALPIVGYILFILFLVAYLWMQGEWLVMGRPTVSEDGEVEALWLSDILKYRISSTCRAVVVSFIIPNQPRLGPN